MRLYDVSIIINTIIVIIIISISIIIIIVIVINIVYSWKEL